MTLEKLFLDFDETFLINHPEFTVEELAAGLQKLQKAKLVKPVTSQNQRAWIRVFQRRKPWWKRFFGLLNPED